MSILIYNQLYEQNMYYYFSENIDVLNNTYKKMEQLNNSSDEGISLKKMVVQAELKLQQPVEKNSRINSSMDSCTVDKGDSTQTNAIIKNNNIILNNTIASPDDKNSRKIEFRNKWKDRPLFKSKRLKNLR
jgi:hypothetical protein